MVSAMNTLRARNAIHITQQVFLAVEDRLWISFESKILIFGQNIRPIIYADDTGQGLQRTE